MNILIGTVAIWIIALWLLSLLRARHPDRVPELWTKCRSLFLFMLPRIFVGLIGAGFMAALLPETLVAQSFGREAGLMGVVFAMGAGALTPGGPFVAFAIGAAALKAGAGVGALVAYVSAWCVVCVMRTLAYELPMMGSQFAWIRIAVSLPFVLILGSVAHLIDTL